MFRLETSDRRVNACTATAEDALRLYATFARDGRQPYFTSLQNVAISLLEVRQKAYRERAERSQLKYSVC